MAQVGETHGVILGAKLGVTEEFLLSGFAPATQVRYRDPIIDFERLVLVTRVARTGELADEAVDCIFIGTYSALGGW